MPQRPSLLSNTHSECLVKCPFSRSCGRRLLAGACDPQLLHDPQSLLLVFLPGHPEGLFVLHDVRQDRATQEHHVLSTRRILNANLEFLMINMKKRRYFYVKSRYDIADVTNHAKICLFSD